MKPTKTLIRALRETAQKLRDGTNYNWHFMSRCNCGLLAQTIMGINSRELALNLAAEGLCGYWRSMAKDRCPATGLPNDSVFRTLAEAGLEPGDYEAIEYCGANRNPVAAWMDTEADKLERLRSTLAQPVEGPL